ncbi:MAG: SurA N-terminal domain-containing protein, partial [Tannerella sp.]|nr:SurA N-terminal domain-containing protein [Tannerella sp.]
MATLEKIRGKAGLLVGIVGLALFAFIIGDLLNSGSSLFRKNQTTVVVVDGNTIDYQDYMNRVNELTEIYKIQSGSQESPSEYASQINQSVYNEIVSEIILGKRLDKLGIAVTPEEMLDMTEGENISPVLRQIPMFQNPETGSVNRNAILQFLNRIKDMDSYPEETRAQLAQAKMMWDFWEKNIKMNRLNEKYLTLLSKSVVPNSLDAQDAFNSSLQNSDIVYVMERFANVADSTIVIPKADIEKLYNERKNMFRQSGSAVIDYIAVDIVPSPEDFTRVSEEMNEIRKEMETTDNVPALVNENLGRYVDAFSSTADFAGDRTLTDFATTAEIGAIEG